MQELVIDPVERSEEESRPSSLSSYPILYIQ